MLPHPTLFDPPPVCSCPTAGPWCCADAVADALTGRAPAVVAAAADERVGADHLARMLLATRVQARDPLSVPRRWRLHVGQLASDPALERALASGSVPLTRDRGAAPATPPAPVRLAGLLAAGHAGVDGDLDVPDGELLALSQLSPAGIAVASAAARHRWTTNLAAARHVVVDGRELPTDLLAACPTAASPLADVCDAVALVVTRDRRLVRPVDLRDPSASGAMTLDDVRGDAAATYAAAATRILAGTWDVAGVRLVTVGRDLAAAGEPQAHGIVVIDADTADIAGSGTTATALPSGDRAAGEALQALAAATEPVHRQQRSCLDAVGAALRHGRLRLADVGVGAR